MQHSENPAPKEARRNKFQFPPIDVEKGYEVVDKLRSIAKSYDGTIAQVALAWLLTKSFISSILIGANTMNQLEDNLKAVEVDLSKEEIASLDEMTAPTLLYPGWMQAMGHDPKIAAALS